MVYAQPNGQYGAMGNGDEAKKKKKRNKNPLLDYIVEFYLQAYPVPKYNAKYENEVMKRYNEKP